MNGVKNCQAICGLKLLNLKTYFRYNISNLNSHWWQAGVTGLDIQISGYHCLWVSTKKHSIW